MMAGSGLQTIEEKNTRQVYTHLMILLVAAFVLFIGTALAPKEPRNIVENETDYAEVYKMMQYLDANVEKQGEYGVLRKGQNSQLYIFVPIEWQYMSDKTRQPEVLQMLDEVKQGKESGYEIVVVYPELRVVSPDTLSQLFGTNTECATDWEWELREKLAECESVYLRKLTSKLQVGEWIS